MSIIQKPRLLLQFIEAGLRLVDSGLGDRSKYVGSSDIGQCFKKSYLSKFQKVIFSAKQLIIFMRGHNAEGIVREGLKNNPMNIKFKEQVEVKGKGNLSFIKTHIDFVVEFPQELLVIECKSISSSLPNNQPRESWILQTILQMGLLKAQTNRSVRGKIVAINVNTGDREEFDVIWNNALFNVAISRANTLWNSMQTKTEPKGEVGDLCGFCPFKGTCETLRANGTQIPKDVQEALEQYKELQETAKKANTDAKAIKENLISFMQATGSKKLLGDSLTASYSERKGGEYISMQEIRSKYPQIAEELSEQKKASTVLRVY